MVYKYAVTVFDGKAWRWRLFTKKSEAFEFAKKHDIYVQEGKFHYKKEDS